MLALAHQKILARFGFNTSAGEAFWGQPCPGVTMFGFSRVPWGVWSTDVSVMVAVNECQQNQHEPSPWFPDLSYQLGNLDMLACNLKDSFHWVTPQGRHGGRREPCRRPPAPSLSPAPRRIDINWGKMAQKPFAEKYQFGLVLPSGISPRSDRHHRAPGAMMWCITALRVLATRFELKFFVLLELDSDQTLLGPSSE